MGPQKVRETTENDAKQRKTLRSKIPGQPAFSEKRAGHGIVIGLTLNP